MSVHDLPIQFPLLQFPFPLRRAYRLTGLQVYPPLAVILLSAFLGSMLPLPAQSVRDDSTTLPAASDSDWLIWYAGEPVPQRGKIVQLEVDGTRVQVTDGIERVVRDVYHWQREQLLPSPFPTRPQIITTAGDRLVGTVEGLEAGRLHFLLSTLKKQPQPWRIPFHALQAAWLVDLPADTPVDPALYVWAEGHKNRDTLRLRNGDVLAGALLEETDALDRHAWQLQTAAGQIHRLVPAQIAAIRFNPTLARRRLPKEPILLLVLQDGSRLHLTRCRLANDQLHGITLWGEAVTIPWSKVVLGCVTAPASPRLTDLTPSKIEQQPYLAGSPPLSFQRRSNGQELQLMSRTTPITVDWGFALPPQTVIHYEMKQRYRRLETWVSLAPEAPPESRVRLRILCDDNAVSLPRDGLLGHGPAQLLQIPLDNVQRLTLIVDFPSRGEPGAVTVWGWPRLVP